MSLGLGGTVPEDVATQGLMIQCEPSAIDGMLSNTSGMMLPLDSRFSASSLHFASTQGYPSEPTLPTMQQEQQQQQQEQQQLDEFCRTPSASPPPNARHRRASSKGRSHHRRKSSSNNAGVRAVSVGFVNFTPDDSRKILTGVAPSGSSKTKARREKEAAEKRRKLSEAAKRAIIEAGGDPKMLEREGLLYLMPET